MSDKPRILFVTDREASALPVPEEIADAFEIVRVDSSQQAISRLSEQRCAGILVDSERFRDAQQLERLLDNERILESMPDGVALLDLDNRIVWANERFCKWAESEEVIGDNFSRARGSPYILGPYFCPLTTTRGSGVSASSTLKVAESFYCQVHVARIQGMEEETTYLIATLSDMTDEIEQQEKLAAIHRAGTSLADLTPGEMFDMEVEDRIELLKSNILHYTQDLLNFDVVEIRLLEQKTGVLYPLMAVGIDDEAAQRALVAETVNNGVTGFVAATGESYLCENTTEDPLYLEALKGAHSSLTVPLIWHDQVVGTFNVESPEAGAFNENDLQFLETFSRDVAIALNTLELLVAQKVNAAQQSVEAIHSAVALPIDEILNDAVNVMERYIGHEPEVVERLQKILRNARDIKQVIHKVGRKMAPAEAVPASVQIEPHPKLMDCRVLVVDGDAAVRNDAHGLLGRYGCIVETAHTGAEAISMVRNCEAGSEYQVVITDIRLEDLTGFELLTQLDGILPPSQLILMTGFGYDPDHSIVQARRMGLHPQGILYKPFRLDQLLETVEGILDG